MWAFIALISIPNSLTHWRSMFRICLIRLWTNRLCHGFDWTCHFGKACEINTGNKTNTAHDCKTDKSAACRWILIKRREMGKKVISSPETGLILSENLFAGQLATWSFLDLFKQTQWLLFQNVPNTVSGKTSWLSKQHRVSPGDTEVRAHQSHSH